MLNQVQTGTASVDTQKMDKPFETLKARLTEIFQLLEKALCPVLENNTGKVFHFYLSDGAVSPDSKMYKQTVHNFQGEPLITIGCTMERPECRFLAVSVVDLVAERLRILRFELGQDYFRNGDFRLFDAETAEKDAKELLDRLVHRLKKVLQDVLGLSVDVVDVLTLTTYETEAAAGNLIFLPPGFTFKKSPFAWSMTDEVKAPPLFCEDHRRLIRKLLAGTEPDKAALVFQEKPTSCYPVFLGVVPLTGKPDDLLLQNSIQIKIHGALQWDMAIGGHLVLYRAQKGPCFPVADIREAGDDCQKKAISNALADTFGQCAPLDKLIPTIWAVKSQRHGAAVVVADWEHPGICRDELKHLVDDNKALQVKFGDAIQSLDSIITSAAKMDGAVLVDAKTGIISALAAILHAPSCIEGKLSRGSRYNSINNAVGFFHKKGANICAFVFSSDGGMDILTAPVTPAPPPVSGNG